jgi:hypothetical protein
VKKSTSAASIASVPSAAVRALASIGWEIEAAEIDLHRGRAMMVLRRADGRWIRLDADELGRASVERWHRHREWIRAKGAAGAERVVDDFLGRDRATGAGSALRVLAAYVAENPAPGHKSIGVLGVRRALALLVN